MYVFGTKERCSASLEGMKRVHPRDALFSFGGKSFQIYSCKIWQIGGKV